MVNMFGRKYYYNPKTLRLEEKKLTRKQRIRKYLFGGLVLIVISLVFRVGYEQVAKSPRLVYYEKQNEQLRQEYRELLSELQRDEQQLALLKRKDDRLYRSIFGMDPIPYSIREAGTGGSPRHSALRTISDPGMVINVFDKLEKLANKAQIQQNSFEQLKDRALENQQLLSRKPSINPISPGDPSWLTSSYGYRRDPFTGRLSSHHGIDIAGPFGLDIHAAGDGVVTIAEYNRHGYGNEVLIDHGFGYSTRYAHLQELLVEPGEKVKRGEVIGKMGNTGRSTGPHLHYEVRLNNRTVNPMYYYYEDLTPDQFELIARRAAKQTTTQAPRTASP